MNAVPQDHALDVKYKYEQTKYFTQQLYDISLNQATKLTLRA